MRTRLFLIPVFLSSFACSQADEYRDEVGVVAETSSDASDNTVAAQAVSLEEETDQYMFAYSWPEEAAAQSGLADELQKRADRNLATLQEEAERDFAAAQEGDWEARPHSATTEWKVVAELPEWLSLSGDVSTYSGGAHGLSGKMSLVWDKQNQRAIKGVDMFVSATALERALGAKLCDALNAERAKRRGQPVDPEAGDPFSDCPDVDEATVLVGSSDGKTFDRIGIYFGPYVAGSYAEGSFELDFPVTGAVLDAVKPEYASAFSVQR